MKNNNKKLPLWQKILRTAAVLLFFVLVGFCCGLLMVVVMEGAEGTPEWLLFTATMVSLYLSVFLHTAAHEFGHFLFGKLTGYRFSSYRLGSIMLLRQEGHLRLKRFSLAGTGGQCLMDPPEMEDGSFPYILYNLGGSLVNLALALLSAAVLLLPGLPPLLRGFLLFFAVTGVLFGLMNGIPLPSSLVNNDGRNTLDIHRSPEARRAFWIQMKANVLTAAGVRTKDMPAEWFVMPDAEAMRNPMIASLGVGAASRFMDEGNFAAAEEVHRLLLDGDNGMVEVHRRLLVCDRVFCALMAGRYDEAAACLDKEQRQFMKSMGSFPSVIRTLYAASLLMDKDQEAAAKYKTHFEKCEKSYPYPVDCQTERELMAMADERAVNVRANQQI